MTIRHGYPPFKEDPRCSCAGMPPAWWYPSPSEIEPGPGYNHEIRQQQADARKAVGLCNRCPFKTECLEWALDPDHPERYGIWGGKSERERKKMRKERADVEPDRIIHYPTDNTGLIL